MNNEKISFAGLLPKIGQEFIPSDVLLEVKKWDYIIKSPYGNSFYNGPVSWNYKEPDSYRISDHWNFKSKGKLHCRTTTPIEENTWALAQYSAYYKRYIIIKTFESPKTKLQNTYTFKMLNLEISREIALKKLRKATREIIQKCELGFLNRYYRLLEEFNVSY